MGFHQQRSLEQGGLSAEITSGFVLFVGPSSSRVTDLSNEQNCPKQLLQSPFVTFDTAISRA